MGFMDKVKAKKVSGPQALTPEGQAALEAHEKKIEDVLEVLQILPTFEIPADVYMEQDLKDVSFDVQVPKGYDEGQVMYFVSQVKSSIAFYVGLLRKRNEDVAKLASVVDKLQVDANNLRWEAEIANGVSVMPTLDDTDLENQNMELRLQVKSLEDKLRAAQEAGGDVSGLPVPTANTVPLDAYEKVADELSASRSRVQALEDEVFHLKSRIALEEDEADDELALETPEPLSLEELEELGVKLPTPESRETLPEALPLPPEALGTRHHEGVLPPPVSYMEEEEGVGEIEGLSFGTFGNDHDGDPRTLSVYDDDDDDSLEDLMKALRERE